MIVGLGKLETVYARTDHGVHEFLGGVITVRVVDRRSVQGMYVIRKVLDVRHGNPVDPVGAEERWIVGC